MKSIFICLSIMQHCVDGACIKLQNFNTSKGDLEGAYLNGILGVGDLNYIPPPKDYLTSQKKRLEFSSNRVPYVDKNTPINWMIIRTSLINQKNLYTINHRKEGCLLMNNGEHFNRDSHSTYASATML